MPLATVGEGWPWQAAFVFLVCPGTMVLIGLVVFLMARQRKLK